jgi:hypothetical protein
MAEATTTNGVPVPTQTPIPIGVPIEVSAREPRRLVFGRAAARRRNGSASALRNPVAALRARLRGRSLALRGRRNGEVGAAAKRNNGKAVLTVGKSVVAVLLGIASGAALDVALAKYVTTRPGYRALALSGTTLLAWFIGGALLGPVAKLFASIHALTGAVFLTVDWLRQRGADSSAAPKPATQAAK